MEKHCKGNKMQLFRRIIAPFRILDHGMLLLILNNILTASKARWLVYSFYSSKASSQQVHTQMIYNVPVPVSSEFSKIVGPLSNWCTK